MRLLPDHESARRTSCWPSTGPPSASSRGVWAADQGSSAGRGWAVRPSLWGVWEENGPSACPGHHLCLREKEA